MFCKNYYKRSKSSKTAAIKAGYAPSKAEKIAQQLLNKREINSFMQHLQLEDEKKQTFQTAITCLKKLIKSKINDSVILANKLEIISDDEIKNLNLLQISELKKLKDGAIELKFFDKIKAIEMLLYIMEKLEKINGNTQMENFLNAIKTTSNDTEKLA